MRLLILLAMLGTVSTNFLIADTIPELSRGSNRSLNLSSADNAYTIQYQGKLKSLMIFVDLDNLEGKDNPHQPEAIAKKLLGVRADGKMDVVDFYQQQSNGKFSFEIDIKYEWMRLKKLKSNDYPDSNRPVKYIEDSLLLAQKRGISLRKYQIVYIVAPKGLRHNSPTHFLSADELKKIRNPPKVVVTFGDDGQQSRIQHLIHETGHGMGLPDLYLYSPQKVRAKLVTPGPWAIMADNWSANYFCAWTRHLWGWMDNKHKVYFKKRGQKSIELAPIDAESGIKMIAVPSEKFPDELIVIENPKPWEESIKNGVLIYKVNGTIATGKGPMSLELPEGISDVKDRDALWQPGQTYRNPEAKIEINILKGVRNSFVLKITKD